MVPWGHSAFLYLIYSLSLANWYALAQSGIPDNCLQLIQANGTTTVIPFSTEGRPVQPPTIVINPTPIYGPCGLDWTTIREIMTVIAADCSQTQIRDEPLLTSLGGPVKTTCISSTTVPPPPPPPTLTPPKFPPVPTSIPTTSVPPPTVTPPIPTSPPSSNTTKTEPPTTPPGIPTITPPQVPRPTSTPPSECPTTTVTITSTASDCPPPSTVTTTATVQVALATSTVTVEALTTLTTTFTFTSTKSALPLPASTVIVTSNIVDCDACPTAIVGPPSPPRPPPGGRNLYNPDNS